MAVCVETSQGIVIEQLLESGVSLYPISPVSSKAYRERKVPSGSKSDHLDAWSLADALRVDGHGWRALAQEDPLVAELRLLCRDEVALIRGTHRSGQPTPECAPGILSGRPGSLRGLDDAGSLGLSGSLPSPQALTAAGQPKWEKFLHSHKLARPQTYAKRLEIFARASEFVSGEVLTRTKSRLALTCTRMLRVLEHQIEAYRAEIEKLFAQHPDHDLFGSLPRSGSENCPALAGRNRLGPHPL